MWAYIKKTIFILFICYISGCAWLLPERISPQESAQFLQTTKIINLKRLEKGGNLLIVPFTAGAGVEATEELDKVSLMIVKGIIDILNENNSNFRILVSENAEQADLIIKGHIISMKKTPLMKKWIRGKSMAGLAINGKMINSETGEAVVIFSDNRKVANKKETHKELGYMIGQDVGRFMHQGVKGFKEKFGEAL